MFTSPDTFAAGAALRPVTDWAHYNHGYTSNILNVPTVDPEAFKQSSPIYFADGLKGRLLILHGMADDNVFLENTTALAATLQAANKPFEMMLYPGKTHGAVRDAHPWLTMFDFLDRRVLGRSESPAPDSR